MEEPFCKSIFYYFISNLGYRKFISVGSLEVP